MSRSICASAYGLARLRRWLWLAIARRDRRGDLARRCSCSSSKASTASTSRSRVSSISSSRRRWSSSLSRSRRIGGRRKANSAPIRSPRRRCSAAERSPASSWPRSRATPGSGPGWIVAAALVVAMLGLTGLRLPAVASASAVAGRRHSCGAWRPGEPIGALVVDPYSFFAQWPTMGSRRLFVGFGLICFARARRAHAFGGSSAPRRCLSPNRRSMPAPAC